MSKRTHGIPALFLLVAVGSGCEPGGYPGWDLDRVAKSVDKFGTLSISGATLIEPDPRFQLDLELSGNEIFNRNRIEGSSGIRQYDAADVQISVKAEIIANMVDQMKATTDPSLLQSLRTNLMAAAFQGLASELPDELQPFAKALDLTGPSGSAPDAGPGEPEDGGLEQATKALSEAKGVTAQIENARVAKDEAAALTSSEAALKSAEQLASYVEAAGQEARALALKVESVALGDLTRFGRAKTEAQDAIIAADAAEAEAARLRERIVAARGKLSEEGNDSDKPKTATEAHEAVKGLAPDASTAEDAAKKARRAEQTLMLGGGGAVAGKKPGAAPQQKILQADPIAKSDRLALARIPEFREALANYEGDLDLNLRQLLILTASDKMTLEMLRWLSYPRGYGPGKRVFLCMASVNCTPGRITYDGYIGQVDLAIRYGVRDKDTKEVYYYEQGDQVGKHPVAFAVFPFIDSQVLDLRTSRRRSFTMALQLIVNGYPAAGRALLDYGRSREQDVHTITGINTVSSYSTGHQLGFVFSPRLVAQGDPANMNTAPRVHLQPQSFPAIIMIACDTDDLRSPGVKEGEKGYWEGAPDHVAWFQTYHWRRAPAPSADRWPLGRWFSQWLHPRMTEIDIAHRANHLDAAYKTLYDKWDPYSGKDEDDRKSWKWRFRTQALRARLASLASAGLGANVFFKIPLFTSGESKRLGLGTDVVVEPRRGWVNRPSTFFVYHPDREPIFKDDFVVSIGGREANATRVNDDVLKVVLPPWIETFDYEAAEAIQKTGRYHAPLVVATDAGVFNAEQDIEFKYYAPTPLTALGRKPATEAAGETLTAKLETPRICLENNPLVKRDPIKIKLSSEVEAETGTIILRARKGTTKGLVHLLAKIDQTTVTPIVEPKEPKEPKHLYPSKLENLPKATAFEGVTLILHEGQSDRVIEVTGALVVVKELTASIVPEKSSIKVDVTGKKIEPEEVKIRFSFPVSVKSGKLTLTPASDGSFTPPTIDLAVSSKGFTGDMVPLEIGEKQRKTLIDWVTPTQNGSKVVAHPGRFELESAINGKKLNVDVSGTIELVKAESD